VLCCWSSWDEIGRDGIDLEGGRVEVCLSSAAGDAGRSSGEGGGGGWVCGGGCEWGEVHFARAYGGDAEAWEEAGGDEVSDAAVKYGGREEKDEGEEEWVPD